MEKDIMIKAVDQALKRYARSKNMFYNGTDTHAEIVVDAVLEVLQAEQGEEIEEALFSKAVDVAKEIFSKYQLVANDPTIFAVMDRNGSEEMWADYLAEQFAPIIAKREAALQNRITELEAELLTTANQLTECVQGRLQGWISVEDRLPDESGEVLICLETGGIYVSFYKKSRNLFDVWGAGRDPYIDMKTSYWMPLPEPILAESLPKPPKPADQ